ncbi:hypothetical protein GGI35DRAFT_351727 [Trichoderma velutinum]
MIPIQNADIHQTDPASSYPKPIYLRQTQLTETAFPATASLITMQSTHHHNLHTLFNLITRYPFSRIKPHQQQSQRSNLAFLLMQGQHINPKE